MIAKTQTRIPCNCGHYHDGDVCDDCKCPIYQAKTQTHTPTPWIVAARNESDNTIDIRSEEYKDRELVASVTPKPHYADNQEANAAYIVKCVNAHDELVSELRDALDELKAKGYTPDVLARGYQALARAEGKE